MITHLKAVYTGTHIQILIINTATLFLESAVKLKPTLVLSNQPRTRNTFSKQCLVQKKEGRIMIILNHMSSYTSNL